MRKTIFEKIYRRLLVEVENNACPQCGKETKPGKKFCGNCGAKLLEQCPKCGNQVKPGKKFCGECGTKLGTAGGEDKTKEMQQKIQSIADTSQDAWSAISKKYETSQVADTAMQKLFQAYSHMSNAYSRADTKPEDLKAAKEEYIAAKKAMLDAAEEDEKAFAAWLKFMEKSGGVVDKGLIDAQKKQLASYRGVADKGDEGVKAAEAAQEKFKNLEAEAEKKLKKMKDMHTLPKGLTGDMSKDYKIHKEFLQNNPAISGDNAIYLAYVLGILRSMGGEEDVNMKKGWKALVKANHDFEKDKLQMTDDELNAVLDAAGGMAAKFKK